MKYLDNLICPKCKVSSLELSNEYLKCKNYICSCGVYSFINTKPILINFNNSIVNKEFFEKNLGNSTVLRNNYNKFNLLKSLFKVSSITENNISLILNSINNDNFKILIIGGGEKGNGLNHLYDKYRENIISIDIYDSENVDIICDAHDLPFKNDSFDFVIVQAVLEHVLSPNIVVQEIYRVLSEGGIVYSEIPFLQQVHEGPYDFTRFTHSGHRYLFKNFCHIKSGFTKGSAHFFLWALDGFMSSLFRSKKIGKFFKLLFFWILYFEKFIPEKYNLDFAGGTFFLGSKMQHKNHNSDIVNFYRGSQTS